MFDSETAAYDAVAALHADDETLATIRQCVMDADSPTYYCTTPTATYYSLPGGINYYEVSDAITAVVCAAASAASTSVTVCRLSAAARHKKGPTVSRVCAHSACTATSKQSAHSRQPIQCWHDGVRWLSLFPLHIA